MVFEKMNYLQIRMLNNLENLKKMYKKCGSIKALERKVGIPYNILYNRLRKKIKEKIK